MIQIFRNVIVGSSPILLVFIFLQWYLGPGNRASHEYAYYTFMLMSASVLAMFTWAWIKTKYRSYLTFGIMCISGATTLSYSFWAIAPNIDNGWIMAPAYFLGIILFILGYTNHQFDYYRSVPPVVVVSIIVAVIALLLTSLRSFDPAVLPVFK